MTTTLPALYNPGMSPIEWREITPEEMIRDIENSVRQYRENKYAFQTGLKDLDFDINDDLLKTLELSVPFQSISQAEQALCGGAIHPVKFIEDDNTEHQVLHFDHRPVGYSGFMNCVAHSLALTSHGLFEVGRYPAVSLGSQSRYWQWFLHRRLATTEEVHELCESQGLSGDQFMEKVYQAFVDG
ncbi:MAG: hypothetical protein JW862_18335 [Anaerolineales bacterium]|nr:hypothetical protein [Anaerolineales bacterium]